MESCNSTIRYEHGGSQLSQVQSGVLLVGSGRKSVAPVAETDLNSPNPDVELVGNTGGAVRVT